MTDLGPGRSWTQFLLGFPQSLYKVGLYDTKGNTSVAIHTQRQQ